MTSANILGCKPRSEAGKVIEFVSPSGNKISFICLTTAFFSDKDLSDKSEAPAPAAALRRLLQDTGNLGQKIVMGHHPINWFLKESATPFTSLLIQNDCIYLHGHDHEIEVLHGQKGLYSLGFGAAYIAPLDNSQQTKYCNTFAICELGDSLDVEFYAWDISNGLWIVETRVPPELSAHNPPGDTRYKINLPTTHANDANRGGRGTYIDNIAETRLKLDRPVWIDGDKIIGWSKLLEKIDVIRGLKNASKLPSAHEGSGYVSFIAEDTNGKHLISASSAPSSVITYEQIQNTNTMLDTESLDSCIVATFGRLSDEAATLASRLKSKKPLVVLDGKDISEKISTFPILLEIKGGERFNHSETRILPLIVDDEVAFLVRDSIADTWFCVVRQNGDVLPESHEIVFKARVLLPELASAFYKCGKSSGVITNATIEPAFDREKYLKTAFKLFDDVRYAGLAALGFRLPTDSLRKLYVPAAADVSQSQSASEALQRALDDFVDNLKLDGAQRDQLEIQLKNYYGISRTAEAGEARRLYQSYGNILLLGDPGSGKTCFVRNEILAYCNSPDSESRESWYSNHTPIFLPLADAARLAEKKVGLLNICVQFSASRQLDISDQQLEVLLSRGEVAFFFDGLDEVGSLEVRQALLRQIGELIDRYESLGNRFVITSRPAAVHTVQVPGQLQKLTLRGLTDDEIRLLATRIMSMGPAREGSSSIITDDSSVVDQLIQDCQDKPGIRRLARNPLLLTLLVLIYANSGPLAARRHFIYSQAVKTLVSVRHRSLRDSVLSEADLRQRLGKVALSIYRGKISEIPTRLEIRKTLCSDKMTENGYLSCDKDVDAFLQYTADSTGLVIVHPRSNSIDDDVISFMHHSFLEYYAAIGFMGESEYQSVAPEVSLRPRWHDVITLMFGLLSEQGDITEFLKAISEDRDEADRITSSRVELALECALECDVPPEESQKYLALIISDNLEKGPGCVIADVREDIAGRVRELLEVTGSIWVRRMLVNGAKSEDSRTAAVYIDFIGRLGQCVEEDPEFIACIEDAYQRKDPLIRIACITAMQSVPSLRTERSLDQLRESLAKGGILEKHVALQLLDVAEGLIQNYSDEVIVLLESKKTILSNLAARCVLAGGIFAKDGYEGRHLLDRALQAYMRSVRPKRALSQHIVLSINDLDKLIYSSSYEDRILGIRSLVTVGHDQNVIHDYIFSVLKEEENHEVRSACLDALSMNTQVIRISSLADTDLVCACASEKHGNVRKSAIKALRSFPTMDAVTRTLRQRYQDLRVNDIAEEREEVIRSLSTHGIKSKQERIFLQSEMVTVLLRHASGWGEKRKGLAVSLLLACEQMGGLVEDGKIASILYDVAVDYKTPLYIRKLAVRVFGRISQANLINGNRIIELLDAKYNNIRLSTYRAAASFVEKCKGSVETVRVVLPILKELKIKLISCWKSEFKVLHDRIDYAGLRDIREALLELENVTTSYDEFSARMTAEEYASQGKLEL